MKKFMVLYMAPSAQFEQWMKTMTPEQQEKGMDAWMAWMNANKASLADGGAPLGKTKRVDANGTKDTKNEVGGYSIVQAESHDAAAKMLRSNIGRLPVVDRDHSRRIIGYLGRPGIMAARLRRLDEEHILEPGWIGRFFAE